jgi:hypothetical protein
MAPAISGYVFAERHVAPGRGGVLPRYSSTVSRRLSVIFGIFEATGADVAHLGEEHSHRVLHVHGKGDKVVLVPLPPAARRRSCGRARYQGPFGRTDPAHASRHPDGPARCYPSVASAR